MKKKKNHDHCQAFNYMIFTNKQSNIWYIKGIIDLEIFRCLLAGKAECGYVWYRMKKLYYQLRWVANNSIQIIYESWIYNMIKHVCIMTASHLSVIKPLLHLHNELPIKIWPLKQQFTSVTLFDYMLRTVHVYII